MTALSQPVASLATADTADQSPPEDAVAVVAPGPAPLDPHLDELVDDLETLLHTSVAACLAEASDVATRAEAEGEVGREMVASHYVATARRLSGDDAGALSACDRTEQIALSLDAPVWRARALACRGLVHHEVDDDEQAIDLLRRAVELCRQAQDLTALAEALALLGRTYASIHAFTARAAATLAEARKLWLAGGDLDGAAATQVSLAINYLTTSRQIAKTNVRGAGAAARQALRAARLAVEEADAAGLASVAVDARLAAASALAAAGEDEALGPMFDSIAAMLTHFPSPAQRLALHRQRAAWLRRAGRWAEASEEAREGLTVCETLQRPADRVALLELLASSLEDAGEVEEALVTRREQSYAVAARVDSLAERRSALLAARLDAEEAQRIATEERRRAVELERRNAELSWEATHDALTGLANRRALEAELAAHRAADRSPLSVCLVDVDLFKRVNDECSHQTGDHVLARLGETLAAAVRGGDLASRYGGEEFALVLPGAEETTAVAVADRLRRRVEAMVWEVPVPGDRITVSIGVATAVGGFDSHALLARADVALYRAKRSGRNRVEAG